MFFACIINWVWLPVLHVLSLLCRTLSTDSSLFCHLCIAPDSSHNNSHHGTNNNNSYNNNSCNDNDDDDNGSSSANECDGPNDDDSDLARNQFEFDVFSPSSPSSLCFVVWCVCVCRGSREKEHMTHMLHSCNVVKSLVVVASVCEQRTSRKLHLSLLYLLFSLSLALSRCVNCIWVSVSGLSVSLSSSLNAISRHVWQSVSLLFVRVVVVGVASVGVASVGVADTGSRTLDKRARVAKVAIVRACVLSNSINLATSYLVVVVVVATSIDCRCAIYQTHSPITIEIHSPTTPSTRSLSCVCVYDASAMMTQTDTTAGHYVTYLLTMLSRALVAPSNVRLTCVCSR